MAFSCVFVGLGDGEVVGNGRRELVAECCCLVARYYGVPMRKRMVDYLFIFFLFRRKWSFASARWNGGKGVEGLARLRS